VFLVGIRSERLAYSVFLVGSGLSAIGTYSVFLVGIRSERLAYSVFLVGIRPGRLSYSVFLVGIRSGRLSYSVFLVAVYINRNRKQNAKMGLVRFGVAFTHPKAG